MDRWVGERAGGGSDPEGQKRRMAELREEALRLSAGKHPPGTPKILRRARNRFPNVFGMTKAEYDEIRKGEGPDLFDLISWRWDLDVCEMIHIADQFRDPVGFRLRLSIVKGLMLNDNPKWKSTFRTVLIKWVGARNHERALELLSEGDFEGYVLFVDGLGPQDV